MDLFAPKIMTRERAIREAPASTIVRGIDATLKALPQVQGFRWHRLFLKDIRRQLAGGYRLRLSHKQVSNFLIAADSVKIDPLHTHKEDGLVNHSPHRELTRPEATCLENSNGENHQS